MRDRVHEFDVMFQPSPFYLFQRPSPWRASPDVAASPTGSAVAGRLPVKAAVAKYAGDAFRRQATQACGALCGSSCSFAKNKDNVAPHTSQYRCYRSENSILFLYIAMIRDQRIFKIT